MSEPKDVDRTSLFIVGETAAAPDLDVLTVDAMRQVNAEAWTGLPPGTCQLVDLSCCKPSLLTRLWAWLFNRKAVYEVTVTFSISRPAAEARGGAS